MAKVAVLNMTGAQVGEVELNDAIFAVEIKEHLVHQAVVAHLANLRQGNQSAKTRAEVRGGGRKPWKQKGTGRARQGSIRAVQWVGGGVAFAPKPRNYSFKMNFKERRIALQSALTSRVNESKFIVLDSLEVAANILAKENTGVAIFNLEMSADWCKNRIFCRFQCSY